MCEDAIIPHYRTIIKYYGLVKERKEREKYYGYYAYCAQNYPQHSILPHE